MVASGVGEGTGACAYRDIIEEPQQYVDGQSMNYAGLGIDKTAILTSVLISAIYLEVAPFALVAGGDAALYYTQAAFSRFHSKMSYCNALML